MLKNRVIPCLLLQGNNLVKSIKFKKHNYIGDPINTVRIFNELEADELCFLDIKASIEKREPNYNLLLDIANECFMPLSYGGGIKTFDQAKKIFSIGFEKIVINSFAFDNLELISEITRHYGRQSVIGSIDVKRTWLGGEKVYRCSGTKKTKYSPLEWSNRLIEAGVGEILLTSIDREGTWGGFDIDLIKKISTAVNVPVIANGGAGSINDIDKVFSEGNVQAVGLGNMVVYQKKGMGVLINMPYRIED